ncbi:MAG: cation:H+ antiporter, partial [Candidatus Eremiobacteraeota bacterium]|nr:cation:H+ antiporter [Candidatus Eremiobacteraeota bacterium]
MLDSLSLPALLAVFVVAAGAIWFAGVKLAGTTDVLATRLRWGEALGGLILLAVATNLPEIAITASAAWRHQIDVATGNILGGIAVQTVILAALDVFGVKRPDPLTYRAASLGLVLEGVLVVAVLVVAIMATQLPASLIGARLAPGDVLIAILWIAGIVLIGKARDGLP